MKSWSECKVLITGGNQGLGKEFAETLKKLGAEVYVTTRKGTQDSFFWDMSDPESTKKLLTDLDEKDIDILIHCAHVFSDKKLILQVKPEEFSKSLTTNLVPIYELSRGLAKKMSRKKFGKILYIGSLISQYGGEGKISYITEKAALDGFVLGFHAEFSGKNVHTNIVHPNIFETRDIFDRIPGEILKQMISMSPTGKLLQMEDVIKTSLALIDPASTRSGESVLIDGGVKW